MGKASRSRRREKKAAVKRARKAANRAKYAEMRRLGQNTLSSRAKRNAKKKIRPHKHRHLIADCGNLGCKKCGPKRLGRV